MWYSANTFWQVFTLQVYVPLYSIFIFVLCHCCAYGLIRFRHKIRNWFGLGKAHFLAKNTCFGSHKHAWKLSRGLENILWFNTYKYWNAVSNCGLVIYLSFDMKVRSQTCHGNIWHVWRSGNMTRSLWHVEIWTYQWFADPITASILAWQLGCIYP